MSTRVVKLLLCAYYYYYYYYFIYLDSLLLLLVLLRHIFKRPITITITVNIWGAYYYYYYSKYLERLLLLLLLPRLLLLLLLLLPLTIPYIITVEPKKHNTSRLQSNIQRPSLLPWYHTLPQTHCHR